jgi:hypothetical protein
MTSSGDDSIRCRGTSGSDKSFVATSLTERDRHEAEVLHDEIHSVIVLSDVGGTQEMNDGLRGDLASRAERRRAMVSDQDTKLVHGAQTLGGCDASLDSICRRQSVVISRITSTRGATELYSCVVRQGLSLKYRIRESWDVSRL